MRTLLLLFIAIIATSCTAATIKVGDLPSTNKLEAVDRIFAITGTNGAAKQLTNWNTVIIPWTSIGFGLSSNSLSLLVDTNAIATIEYVNRYNPNQIDTNGLGKIQIKSGALLTNTSLIAPYMSYYDGAGYGTSD